MTVKELTAKLRKMPQDAQVIMETKYCIDIERVFVDTDGVVVLSEFED